MVATFNTYLDTGGAENAPGASISIDALGPPMLRFKRADNSTIDAADPIPIPAAVTNYSRWKSIFLRCVLAPSLQVDNVRIYSDGADFEANVKVYVGNETPTHNSGATTGYDVADANVTMVANHTDITAKTDFSTFTSVAPKTVTISEAGAIINLAAETSNYVVLQMEVAAGAAPGNLADATWGWLYDEI
jgi:hypothetical protein